MTRCRRPSDLPASPGAARPLLALALLLSVSSATAPAQASARSGSPPVTGSPARTAPRPTRALAAISAAGQAAGATARQTAVATARPAAGATAGSTAGAAARPAAGAIAGSTAGSTARSTAEAAARPRTVSIDVKEADIHNVFRLLARVGGVNIVVSYRVAGRVTLRLKDVSWAEALQVVLNARGLGAEKVGSILQIDTLEALKLRSDALVAAQSADLQATPLKTVILPLNYATADELRPIVSSFLTARGSVLTDARTNTLIVTDIPGSIDRIMELVGKEGSSRPSP